MANRVITRAETLLARWASIVEPLLDGVLEGHDDEEALEILIGETRTYLEDLGHVHTFKVPPQDGHGDARRCHCGVWITEAEYRLLRGKAPLETEVEQES